MGTCEESNPSLETQNHETPNLELMNGGSHPHNIVVEQEQQPDDDDDVDNEDDDHENHDGNQEEEEESVTVELESLQLEGNGNVAEKKEEEDEKNEEREEKEEDEETQNYPLRPNAVDCTFYLKTGTCKFGLNCRFNHPPKRVFQAVVGDKEKGTEESNGMVVPETGKIDCKYFSTPGGCKYGNACRYNHSEEKVEAKTLELNFLGLPIRPLAKECTFYLRNGTCGYGANCRFNHPDPTVAKESEPGHVLANDDSLRGVSNLPKTYESLHPSGVSKTQSTLPKLSNGMNMGNSLPYATGMSSYPHGMSQTPGWNQNQFSMSSANMPPLPHQMLNNFSKKTDPSPHHEYVMQIEEFPERPGQPDCDYFMKTGDCKYRSACRYNHPVSRAPKLRLPPLSVKGSYSRSAAGLPVRTTELSNSNPTNLRPNGVPSAHHQQQMQNGEFPERPGQPECEYYMKTGNCKFRSACRYHHPRNRVSTTSPTSNLNGKGLPLRPGSRICRNYEQQGTCRYGHKCLFHHPDDISSPAVPVAAQDQSTNDSALAAQDHSSNDVAVAAEMESSENNNASSDWGDGWVM